MFRFNNAKLRCPKCGREGQHDKLKARNSDRYFYCRCTCGQLLRVAVWKVEVESLADMLVGCGIFDLDDRNDRRKS
jgi:uncharacterized Zn finger protein